MDGASVAVEDIQRVVVDRLNHAVTQSAARALRAAADLGDLDATFLLARRKAVVLEWRLKQPEAAMRVVQMALDLVGSEPDLEKRRLRLRGRLDRARDPDRRRPKDRNQPLPFPDEPGKRLEDVGVVGPARLLPEPVDGLHRA